MKSLLFTAVLLGLNACAEPPPRSSDARVFVTPDLPVSVDVPSVTNQAGLLRVTLRVVNATPRDLPVLATTDWIDGQGRPIRSLVSLPRQMTVPRFGDAMVDSVAPRDSAVQFRVRIEPAIVSY